jgi:hypothetical protein
MKTATNLAYTFGKKFFAIKTVVKGFYCFANTKSTTPKAEDIFQF